VPLNNCPECSGKLGNKATRCRCGWTQPGAPREVSGAPARPLIPCCFQNCLEGALVRVWTKTGWANVCVTHYPKIETVLRKVDSWQTLEVRKAYEASADYRRRHGVTPAEVAEREAETRKRVDLELAALREKNRQQQERVPGEDDEAIETDPLVLEANAMIAEAERSLREDGASR